MCPAFRWVLTSTSPGIDILGGSQSIVPWFWTVRLNVSTTELDILFLSDLHVYFFFPVIWVQQLDYTGFKMPSTDTFYAFPPEQVESINEMHQARCIQVFNLQFILYHAVLYFNDLSVWSIAGS